ncbi:putative hemolysin [Alphaproteobacteria bacterium]
MHEESSLMLQLIISLILILFNAFFVLSEIAILTSAKAKLHKMAQKGDLGAKKAIKLSHEPDVFLSTVQIGITLISALLGLYSGKSMGEYIGKLIRHIPHIGPYSEIVGLAIALVIVTYFTVLSEIVPKRIAMLHPEKTASLISYVMPIFIKLAYPFIYVLTLSTKYCLKLLRVKENNKHLSLEEIKFMINQTEHSGTLEKIERDMIKRLVNLSNMEVGAIMTPRNKITALDINDDDRININKLKQYHFNYFPVINGDLNQLIGIIAVKKLINANINNEMLIETAKTFPLTYVPEMAKVTKLIELFRNKQLKVAVVLDEYGEIEGIVTLNDILKTFLGDLVILVEGKKPGIIKKKDDSYIVDGNILIEEVMELLQISSLPNDEDEDYRTLAGFILRQLNTLPKIGDAFPASGWVFKVIKMDHFRIDSVLISKGSSVIVDQ